MAAKNSSSDDLREALADYMVHVPLGAGQLLMEKGKELSKKVGSVAQDSGRSVAKTYADLAQRGEKVAKNLRHSPMRGGRSTRPRQRPEPPGRQPRRQASLA